VALLPERIPPVRRLPDGHVSGGPLTQPQQDTDDTLADSYHAGRHLADPEQQADRELSDRDDPESDLADGNDPTRHLPDREYASRELSDGNDATGGDGLPRLGGAPAGAVVEGKAK
jgi:hypothetical protein